MSASVYLVMSGLLWGTGGLTGTEFGHVTGLSALAVAAYRLLAGGGLIVIFRIAAGTAGPARAAWRWPAGPGARAAWTRIAVTGLLAAAFQGCYFTAVSLTSVSLATLVTIGGSPVIVQVAERFRGRGRGAAGATLLALCGLGLLVGLPSGGPGYAAVLASAGFALLAAAGFATLTLIGASPVPGLDDLTVTGFGFTFGGLRGAPAGTAALFALLEPLTATLLAALLLGERLSLPGMAGAALLLAAVVATALRGSPVTAGPRHRSWRRTSLRSAGSSPRPPRSAARR
ncbi:MAG: EamA family transporter [Trebonia sp.]